MLTRGLFFRLLTHGLLLGLTGCASSTGTPYVPACQNDLDCGENEICFPLQGCGDPGGGLVVEVQGNTRLGQLAQDFAIPDGGFKASTSFQIAPARVTGEFVRDGLNYSSAVTVRLRGSSDLIPAVVRTYQDTFVKPERGTYSLPVGAGTFTVTAETADQSVPPVTGEVNVKAGINATLSFAFPAQSETLVVAGRLLKRVESGASPEIPVGQAMDIQAFATLTRRPLSQRVPVTSEGDFVLFVSPDAKQAQSFELTASPRVPGTLVPTKTFTLAVPLEPLIRLQLGEFGDPLPQLPGFVKTTAGEPVVGALVTLEGQVGGGGIFQSKAVLTDAKGQFKVDVLPSSVDGAYAITVVPSPNGAAGVTQATARARVGPPGLPRLEVTTTQDATVICPDKISVIGTVLRPDGSVAMMGTRVVARALERLKDARKLPLPSGESEVFTDESGRFRIELDPAVYQLDFIPGEDLPRTTRIVEVRLTENEALDAGAQSRTVDTKETVLRKGRKVTGTVTAPNANTGQMQTVENATVRYFRVSTVGGVPTSLLLGESLTDASGGYQIVLPAK